METEYDGLIELFQRFIQESLYSMYEHNSHEKDINVSAPQFLIDMFCDGLLLKYGVLGMGNNGRTGNHFIYMGIEFIPCYELEISVWHKDYPQYREVWMLRKLPLNKPYLVQKQPYEKYLLSLKSFLNSPESDGSELKN